MKYIALIFSLFILPYICNAQEWKPEYRTVKKDTINVSGIVYDVTGTPATTVSIISKSSGLSSDRFNVSGYTDKNGRFELKGALPYDTLTVYYWGKPFTILNNGSRYIVIHLTTPPYFPVKEQGQITAQRINHKKTLPKFKVLTNDPSTICAVENMAEFPGGPVKFVQYIKGKIQYPDKAIQNNIEGDVEIGFTVERDGTLTNPKIIRGIGYGCDEEIMKAVLHGPKWKPAIINGRPIITQSSVTINFKLTDK
jgi:TonB family protein